MANNNPKSVSYVDTNALASCKGQIKSAKNGIKTITDILQRNGFTLEQLKNLKTERDFSLLINSLAEEEREEQKKLYKGTIYERKMSVQSEGLTDWTQVFDTNVRYIRNLFQYWNIPFLVFTDDTKSVVDTEASLKKAEDQCRVKLDTEKLSKSLAALKELRAALKKCEELGLSEVVDIFNGGLRYTDDNGTPHGYTIFNLSSETEADLEAKAFNLLRGKCALQ